MAATVEERYLRVFCPTHKISVFVVGTGTILCESGGHALAQNFPHEEFWEYCCDCQHYWPSQITSAGQGREQCPVCERKIARRYLCDQCKLLSVESDETVRRKSYNISQSGAVEPSCPGCMKRARAKLRNHSCDEVALDFTTARETCPFCEETISDPPSFPASVADCLSQLKKQKVQLEFNALKQVLVPAEEGEYVLLPSGNGNNLSIVIPSAARFQTKQAYYAYYEGFYACEDVNAGEVWVIYPAVVDKTEEGWKLRDAGRLEIRREKGASTEKVEAETARLDAPPLCPDCGEALRPGAEFCGGCGRKIEPSGFAGTDLNADAAMLCPQCGTPRKPEYVFCKRCAYRFLPASSGSTENTDAASVSGYTSENDVGTGGLLAESQTTSAAPRSYTGLIVAVVALVALIGLVGLISLSNSGLSVESKLDKAITDGNLFSPSGESAYDLYHQLKSSGARPATLARFEQRLMPLLTTGPQGILDDIAKPELNKDFSAAEMQDAAKRLSWASEIKSNDSSLAARAAYCDGRAAYLNKDKDAAIQAWKRAMNLDTSWALPLNHIGLVYNERKDYYGARPFLTEAIKREPRWAVPYNNLGTSYFFTKDYEQAESYYKQARDLAPKWARPHAWLGELAAKRGDYCTAAEELQKVVDLGSGGNTSINLDTIQKRLSEAQSKCGAD